MDTIIIKNQSDWDALPKSFQEFTIVEIRSPEDQLITVTSIPESSSVVAWGSSRVVAWGSSRVVAWGSSRVVAWEHVSVHVHSDFSSIQLFGWAVGIALVATKKILQKSKTCTVVRPEIDWSIKGWLERHGIKQSSGHAVLFKRVSKDFKTQEGTQNETNGIPKTIVIHDAWNPGNSECGAGKFHACARPYFCDEFRSDPGDVYVAIKIAIEDLHAWEQPAYPHKIAFRQGEVLYVCDRDGNEIKEIVK